MTEVATSERAMVTLTKRNRDFIVDDVRVEAKVEFKGLDWYGYGKTTKAALKDLVATLAEAFDATRKGEE